MSDGDFFYSHNTSKEYKINILFDYDSSDVVCMSDCMVCRFQYVGSTNMAFRLGFNNYKAC